MDAVTTMLPDVGGSTFWIIALGFVVSFVLAFGIGANDVANSFGTSVGSRALTLKGACILATVFEISGAVLLGYKVSDTIRKGIVDVEVYRDNQRDYMLGNLAALGGSSIWLILATFLKMPISGTHSIVGAVLGFSIVARGTSGIQWMTMMKIVGSWFLSPLLSGAVSGSIFWIVRRFILSKEDPITPGLRSLPVFYGLTVFVNIISVTLDGPDVLKFELQDHPWFSSFFAVLISVFLGLTVALLIYFVLVPKLKRNIQQELTDGPRASDALSRSGGANTEDHVVFVIGNDGSITPDDSKEQTPLNISMSDFPAATEKSLEAGLTMKGNGNGFINSNGFSTFMAEPNHNHHNNQHHHSEIINERKNGKNERGNVNELQLEASPVDGLSPNNSAAPLIKPVAGPAEHHVQNQDEGDKPGVGKLFSWLQIMTAAFGSFAHGGNDVSNAIGPLIALYLVYDTGDVGTKAQTPIWLLIYGGAGISLGLWVWGRRVIKTMGEDLTKITPSSGFTIEIGAAITVLLASKIGLPVSTTHCKVGSVVTVGQLRTKGGVDWKLFRNIFFAWIVTVPVSGGLSAILMVILQAVS